MSAADNEKQTVSTRPPPQVSGHRTQNHGEPTDQTDASPTATCASAVVSTEGCRSAALSSANRGMRVSSASKTIYPFARDNDANRNRCSPKPTETCRWASFRRTHYDGAYLAPIDVIASATVFAHARRPRIPYDSGARQLMYLCLALHTHIDLETL
jgi:hypothetical protein